MIDVTSRVARGSVCTRHFKMRFAGGLLALLSGTSLAAQEMRALDLAPPLRVRATIPELSSRPFVGRVARADSTRLLLALTDVGTGLSIPWSTATSIERSLGRNRTAMAPLGLAIGAAAGLGIYAWQIGYA